MTNTKLTQRVLALVAVATLTLSACSSNEDAVKDSSIEKSSTQPATPEPAAPVADVSSPEAKAELRAACDKLTDDEVAVILGVDTAATAWTIDEATDEALEYDMETGEYVSTGKPRCEWIVIAKDGSGVKRTLSMTLRGLADASTFEGSGAVVVPNAGTGTYAADDEATLLISPAGSLYEYTFSADLPLDGTPYQVQAGLRTATAQTAYEAFN